jgi:hypothetical protein
MRDYFKAPEGADCASDPYEVAHHGYGIQRFCRSFIAV